MATRKRTFSGGSFLEAANFIAGRLAAPRLCNSFEKETAVGARPVAGGVFELPSGTAPGGCALGTRRSTGNGGGSFKAGSYPKYDGTCSILGNEKLFVPGDRWVIEASAGSSASIQRRSVRPSSEAGVIKLTRAGGGKSVTVGGYTI